MTAHHTRPDTASDDDARYRVRDLAEVVAAAGRLACRWLAANPDAAARFGAAAGELVGAYHAARDSHRCPF